ncbi:hypothetical protein NLA06_05070 [Desulfomicrobium sp. ZS1]|nr:hypothetical protein [Desulfomicrobium sp. ZS1]MDY0281455.1 hypothetical protein [Salinivirgaceae bacterium]UTF51264.1 hypothetical protein NLA06_05070 [Desulfomicrobium sp. ZS1]
MRQTSSTACRIWVLREIHLKQVLQEKLFGHKLYIVKHGQDMPEIRN